jgi:N-acetylmuramoyl-L-alanine amidase
MNMLRDTAFCLMVYVLATGASAQGVSATAPSVDDYIAKILKETPDAVSVSSSSKVQVAGEPIVLSARIGEHPDRTRFVVELSDLVSMRTFTLSNPNRVVIDMPSVRWHLQGPPRPSGKGAIRSYRYGTFRPGTSRFVIDLNEPVSISDALVLPPEGGYGYRVVVDLFPSTQTKFDRTAGWPADLRARESAAEMASLPLPQVATAHEPKKKVIVIDPGHGGIDPGTVGADGSMEKDVVLEEGLRLRRVLLARGYAVHMTRDSDVYVPLGDRVKIARSWHADLFISIHADSIRDPNVDGLSIYTLSEKGSDKEAAALAAKENRADIVAGVDLSGDNSAVAPILIDLAQRDTMNKSSHFAETAIAELSGVTDILPRQPHRSAALVVLKAPDVPAVLIELGYLSNIHDADQMKSVSWRDKVAWAIGAAVDRQFKTADAAWPEAAQSMQ